MSQAVTDLLDLPIADIITSGRHRLDNGDITGLAASIAQLGLLQPIGVTPDQGGYRLVFGRRRILAHEQLGRTHILARVVNVPAIVLAEHAENEVRKDFTVSERVAIGRAVEEELRAAGERRGRPKQAPAGQTPLLGEIPQNFAEFPGKETRQIAAEKAGFGNAETYRQAKAVVEQAAPELVAAVDQGTVAISTAAKLATAPVEVQRQAATDPKQAIELAKATSAVKVKEIRETAKAEQQIKTAQRREERLDRIAEISQGNVALNLDQQYPVLYADPPWRYEYAETDNRVIENQYPTLPFNDICALPVTRLATPDAVLFLWATSPKLAEAMHVISAWDFTYRTCAIWDKEKIGMGYYFRQQHELLLVATRGALPAPAPAARPPSVFSQPRGEHSAKPEQFALWIEAMYPTLPRIELFCRSPREGWAVWGNQSC